MPLRRAPSRNEKSASSDDIGHGLEVRRTSRQHQRSRFANEKPLSPRSGQSLKLKGKLKSENPIRPPQPDLSLSFATDANYGFVLQTKSEARKSTNNEEELVKYMSKVPGYLQRGEKIQDNVLNFGVLDWGRLEKWTNKQNNIVASEITSRPPTESCIPSTNSSSISSRPREKPSSSRTNSLHKVDYSPAIKPLNGKAINHPEVGTSFNSFSEEKRQIQRKDKPRITEDLKSAKGKEKYSYTTPSSNLGNHDNEILESSNKKISFSDGQPENCAEKFNRLGFDTPNNQLSASGKQDTIVVLFPKDFSRPSSSEISQRTSLDGKSSELNWGSFSDIFSVDEIQTDEPFSDIPHSCPLPCSNETETELDLKLDDLIKAQGIRLPVNENNSKAEAIRVLDQRAPRCSVEMIRESSESQRFGSRMTRSLSFKEGSVQPHLKSTYVTAKSGPAKPEACETPKSNKANINGKTRDSPLRRLLHPLLKPKLGNQMKENPNDLRTEPQTIALVPENEKCEVSTVKALLHLTIKGGLPLFKFVVETNNEILASTVKNLNTFGKDDNSWLYTFYSVHKVRQKSRGWKNQKVKSCGFGYNVIGQMKVSSPQKSEERYMVKESVLYSVDLSKVDPATSEFMTSRELAAIVVKMPNETDKNGRFSNVEGQISGNTTVILPGGDHSLPNGGVPSPLIERWRSGGLCDCGGWDVGCKLRVLTDKAHDRQIMIKSRSIPMQVRCDLFDQGEVKESRVLFSLVPFRDGLFSVEFSPEISSLQAFSICVAVINSQKPRDISYATAQVESKQENGRAKPPHPPLSPVGRV